MFEAIAILFILAILTIAANYALEDRSVRPLLTIAIGLLNLILVVLAGLNVIVASLPDATRQEFLTVDINPTNATIAFIIYLVTAALATALLFKGPRHWLARFFPARQMPTVRQTLDGPVHAADPNAAGLRGYEPDNPIHMLALVLALYLLGTQLGNFALQGGLTGIASDVGITWSVLIANFLPQLIIPILGVGLFLRRDFRQTLDRLGLHNRLGGEKLTAFPNWLESGLVGVSAAIGLLILASVLAAIWMALVPAETFEAQTQATRAIAESINTLGLALGVAALAAIGEEIAFRGAFQPVFGMWATALVFTLTHIQYTLTPATLIIMVVAVALGWLRQRFNLYACIAAHFLYNFIPLALSVLGPEQIAG